jgi:hypothetical protein
LEERVGALLVLAAVLLERFWSGAFGWRWCGGVARWRAWRGARFAVVAAGGRLAQIWATWASDGHRRALDGLGWAGAL